MPTLYAYTSKFRTLDLSLVHPAHVGKRLRLVKILPTIFYKPDHPEKKKNGNNIYLYIIIEQKLYSKILKEKVLKVLVEFLLFCLVFLDLRRFLPDFVCH